MRMWNKASLENHLPHKTMVIVLPPSINIICLFPAAGCGCGGQDGIMPLFLFRSAIVRRLWLETRLLLASFLRRSRAVSRVWPWPLGLPTTLLGRSGRKLEDRENNVLSQERSNLLSNKVATLGIICPYITPGQRLLCISNWMSTLVNEWVTEWLINWLTDRALPIWIYPFLWCMAALLASALSLSKAGSCTNWSLFTLFWNKHSELGIISG